jgi:exopolysaccharide biosynthesis polyprenyl glycosylphosphotransferase
MIVGRHAPSLSVVFVGSSPATKELQEALSAHPQLGYRVSALLAQDGWPDALQKIQARKRNIVVLPSLLPHSSSFTRVGYARAAYASMLVSLPDFYEYIFKRVPLSELRSSWLTNNITNRRPSYERIVRPLERLAALLMLLVFSPLFLLIALLIALTSPGGSVYRQKRIGKNGRIFTLYKFRTMRSDAEKDGARWSDKNDPRVTPIGKILRRTHIDELPQLVNILRGEVVFVGPRPERPEFATELSEKIPYYDIRHLVPPGITGWAQIHYRYGSSVEDAKRKLEFDLFYIKHRSLLLDARVILRTLKLFFVTIS